MTNKLECYPLTSSTTLHDIKRSHFSLSQAYNSVTSKSADIMCALPQWIHITSTFHFVWYYSTIFRFRTYQLLNNKHNKWVFSFRTMMHATLPSHTITRHMVLIRTKPVIPCRAVPFPASILYFVTHTSAHSLYIIYFSNKDTVKKKVLPI
jgi:hypothetical protein